jgi:PAS domain S-box-containing protein
MPKKPNNPADASELRRRAEARLKSQQAGTTPPRTDADIQRLVHELQVHQIELEMQNDELQHARDEMEAGLDKYSDLYDFAPVGYLTLDPAGAIREANLAVASLLGIARSALANRPFGLFVSAADRPAFGAFLKKVFESKVREFCEVTLLLGKKHSRDVRIEATVCESGQQCRAVLEDITERKRTENDRVILHKLESTGILGGALPMISTIFSRSSSSTLGWPRDSSLPARRRRVVWRRRSRPL